MSANPPCMVTGWSSLLMRVPSGNTSTHSPRCSAACARRTAFRSAVPRLTGMAPARENSHDTKSVLLNSLFEIGLTRMPWKYSPQTITTGSSMEVWFITIMRPRASSRSSLTSSILHGHSTFVTAHTMVAATARSARAGSGNSFIPWS